MASKCQDAEKLTELLVTEMQQLLGGSPPGPLGCGARVKMDFVASVAQLKWPWRIQKRMYKGSSHMFFMGNYM